ncbi:lysozyme inhibitor LprI family protein [Novosphingobium aquimarinum]|uniref:lysozyme inhibitor LprI family protein n=1 Tax=Novosphingobium aquimarinum TaxID=2682494 RepID=UPI0012EBB513|nr:lysozyme inhibitor LprI family protein [Novosphingobium aquimarinum]
MKTKIVVLLSLAMAACAPGSEQQDAEPDTVTASPSFDCTGEREGSRSLVCSDAELAALDREMARLYELARTTPNLDADRAAELEGTQQVWLKGRDACANAPDPRYCLFSSYSGRINELRMVYADAGGSDTSGISSGPVPLACDGLDFPVGLTLLRSDPGGAFVFWKDQAVALRRVRDGKVERYAGDNNLGDVVLSLNFQDAELVLPGEAGPRRCRIEHER